MARDSYKVAALNSEEVVRLIQGLAFVKTLATRSEARAAGMSLTGQVTHVSFGENFAQSTFKRWVKEESNALLYRFQNACLQGPSQAWQWLDSANKARNQYFRTYQHTIENLNRINAQLASAYRVSTRIGATVQLAAETSLVVYGLVGGAATMTVNLAIKKFVVGVGSGMAISLVEDWSSAKDADLIVTPTNTLISNIPGTIDDTFRNICNLLNSWTISKLQSRLTSTRGEIEKLVEQKNSLPRGSRGDAQKTLKPLYEQEKQLAKQIKSPGSALGKFGGAFTALNWGLAVKSEIDSINKFAKHWNGES
jgi:hypothetical protein